VSEEEPGTQEHTMTSYINQTLAREHIAQMIEAAELRRQRREIRQAQREARAARRNERLATRGASNGSAQWPSQIGYAAAR
jgi:hypothetical protein